MELHCTCIFLALCLMLSKAEPGSQPDTKHEINEGNVTCTFRSDCTSDWATFAFMIKHSGLNGTYFSRHKLLMHNNSTKLSMILILLLSGDVEMNPGPRPPKCPCGSCNKAVQNTQAAICCDDCNRWYHKDCIGLCAQVYTVLETQKSCSWICCNCGIPNFTSDMFDITDDSFHSVNSFDTLNSSLLGDTPAATSTPLRSKQGKTHTRGNSHKKNKAKLLLVNCQSVRNKSELATVIDTYQFSSVHPLINQTY